MWVRLSTDSVPKTDRFGWWHQMTTTTLIPTILATADATSFDADADVLDLGAGQQITRMTYRPVTSRRTPRLIQCSDPEYYQLSLTVCGRMGLSQSRRDTTLAAGDLAFYDSSRPFHGWTAAEDGKVVHTVAHFPRSAVPARRDLLEGLTATRIPGDTGFGGLLAHLLMQVTTDPGQYQAADAVRLSALLLDLVAATAAQRAGRAEYVGAETRWRALAVGIDAFIRRHLGDPHLTPAQVAAAHHISVRTLHRLFRQRGTTVAAHIRRQRLEAARRDLTDPALGALPVHAIGARWGFPRPADFARAFRTAYGIPPRDYREQQH
ncbi:helix-turn-helix domain-containing protein [Phytohabitans flavus]|uniref:helix-turn-helix domain-containing protein n=1 Tax=Phytohabitans flavus TaxID=1076124 RepID=UPI0031F17E45